MGMEAYKDPCNHIKDTKKWVWVFVTNSNALCYELPHPLVTNSQQSTLELITIETLFRKINEGL
jgi:hypothetical protein